MQITLRDAIKKAIEIEKEVTEFYQEKMVKAEYPGSKKLLEYLVEQKEGHVKFYEEYLQRSEELGGYCSMPLDFMDYQIAENLIDQKITYKSKIQDILIFAAQQEQRIYDYYMKLSKEYADTEIGFVWECFARESLIHKERFEREYDQNILKEM